MPDAIGTSAFNRARRIGAAIEAGQFGSRATARRTALYAATDHTLPVGVVLTRGGGSAPRGGPILREPTATLKKPWAFKSR